MSQFEDTLLSYFESLKFSLQTAPLNLGGISASGGGDGGPPGGFIGYLPQTRISYDYTEAEAITSVESILASGESLLDNLNAIRYRIRTVENLIESGEVGGTITVKDDGITIDPDVTIIDFQNNIRVNAGDPGTVGVKVTGETEGSVPFVDTDVAENSFVEDNDNLYYNAPQKAFGARTLRVGRKELFGNYDPYTAAPKAIIWGEDEQLSYMMIGAFGGEGVGYPFLSLIHSRGTADAITASLNNDILGGVVARGHDGVGFEASSRARLYFKANQDHIESAHGTKAELWLTPNGSDTPENILTATTKLLDLKTDIDFDKVVTVEDELKLKIKKSQPIITFIFDDGNVSDYNIMLPIFQAQGEVACSAIITDQIGGVGHLSWAEVQELESDGWEILSHSKTHPYLTTLSEVDLITELSDSKSTLESQGINVRNFAYPYGDENETVRRLTSSYYRSARTTTPLSTTVPNPKVIKTYELPAFNIDDHTNLTAYETIVDLADNTDTWVIFYAHVTTSDDATAIDTLIDYIQAKGISILTVDEALDTIGNTIGGNSFAANERGLMAVDGYLDTLCIGKTLITSGYILDVNGFINSYTTVDQSTHPSFQASQTASILQDGSIDTGSDETLDNIYEARKFTADGNHNARSFSVKLKASSVPTNRTQTIIGYIYTDVAGAPGTAINTIASSVMFGTLTTSYIEYHFNLGTSVTLVNGTDYWYILKLGAAPTGGATISADRSGTGTAIHAYSTNGTAWTTENSKAMWFKTHGRTGSGQYGFSTQGYGVFGYSKNNFGVYGYSDNNYGVCGLSANSYGVVGTSVDSFGVKAQSTNSYGLYAISTAGVGLIATSTSSTGGQFNTTSGVAIVGVVNPSSTNTSVSVLDLYRRSSGTVADNIGGLITLNVKTSVGDKTTAEIKWLWPTSTDASRKGRLVLSVYDTAIREGLRVEASGSVAMIGFLGAAAVIRQATTGTVTGFTQGTGNAVNDVSTFTGNTGSTAYTIGDIILALKNYGLLVA